MQTATASYGAKVMTFVILRLDGVLYAEYPFRQRAKAKADCAFMNEHKADNELGYYVQPRVKDTV